MTIAQMNFGSGELKSSNYLYCHFFSDWVYLSNCRI